MSDGSITAPSSASQPVGDGFPQLLERVRVGDEQAARSVVERLYDQVRRIVLAHLPRREDPEDLMQEIFLKVFSRLGQYRGDVPFENWVARVALFTCLDGLRRQQCRPELRWADLSIEESRLLENLAQEREAEPASPDCARELVERLLAGLKAEEQLLIRWLDLEQKTIAEVCALTGWNSGVTRIRAFRARRKLRELLKKMEKSADAFPR
jgi:RNA polymerase sigma-70 factor (ECF subfamily)